MKSTAFILMIITLISKVFGLLRETVLSSLFGTGDVASAFMITQTIAIILVSFVSGGLATGFIPTYNLVVKKHGRRAGDHFTSNVNNIVVLIMAIFAVLGILFAPQIVRFYVPGYEGYRYELTVYMVRFAMITIIPSIMAAVFRGYLNANDNFYPQNLQGFILNTLSIVTLFLAAKTGKDSVLAIGLMLAIALQYILYIPAVRKEKFHYDFGVDFKDPYVRRLLFLAIPIILGSAVTQINIMIDNNIASMVDEAGVASLNYANKLVSFADGIIITTMATVVFPELSRRAINKDMVGLKRTVLSSLSTMSILVLPATVGLMIFAKPIVQLVFERGQFTSEDTLITSGALIMYSLSLMGIAIREVMSKSFYSLGDTKTPTWTMVYMVIVNVIGNLLLSRIFGIRGLALATSISSIFGAVLLSIRLRRKIGRFPKIRHYMVDIFKMFLATLLMAGASLLVYRFLLARISSETLSLLIAIVVAVGVYGGSLILFKVEELKIIIHAFLKRNKK